MLRWIETRSRYRPLKSGWHWELWNHPQSRQRCFWRSVRSNRLVKFQNTAVKSRHQDCISFHLKHQFLTSLLDSKGQSKYAHPSTTNCTRSRAPLKISIEPFHPRIAIVLWRHIASVYRHWTLSQWKFASISWMSSRRVSRRSSSWTHARHCRWHSA